MLGHSLGRPREVVVKDSADRILDAHVHEGGIEKLDRPPIEFRMLTIACVHPQHMRLVAHRVREQRRPTERLRPVGSEAFEVSRVLARMRERVTHQRIGQAPFMPCPRQRQ